MTRQEKKTGPLYIARDASGVARRMIGAMQDLSERTVQRKWEKARIYLHRSIRADLPV